MRTLLLPFAGSLVLLASCCSTRKIQTVVTRIDSVAAPDKTSERSRADSMAFIATQLSALRAGKIKFNTFSARVDLDYRESDGRKYDLNAHIRMQRDSVIWVSITAVLGIEGLRALITRDSVKILDKQNKTYTARSVAYLQEITALPLDLSTLQDLLIGNPVFVDSNVVSYSISDETISLVSIGQFFKNLITLQRGSGLLLSSKLDDVQEERNRTCHLTYDRYEEKEGVLFPSLRTISVSESRKLDIRLNFKQYGFNEKLSFPFPVPKNYEWN
ncbi:MAG TPA: DUF4292 domain-containing protein [Chitinophagaceae bacterium]|nr:DUF4292 domain-containing protein [Chitinophagaceae bacterium]